LSQSPAFVSIHVIDRTAKLIDVRKHPYHHGTIP
jgi:hypothetical protein